MAFVGTARPAGRAARTPAVERPAVRYVGSADGPRIAWSTAGTRRPALLSYSGLASHLILDWADGPMGRFYRSLAARRRLIRYDRPGIGLADPSWTGFDVEREIDMMLRVLDASGESTVALLGRNMSGPIAVAFAARFPERVSHLVLFGTAARILAPTGSPRGVQEDLADAIERLVRAEWGLASPAVARIMLPDATADEVDGYVDYMRASATGDAIAAIIHEHIRLDCSDLLSAVQAPTLVLHRRDDHTVSLDAARSMAEQIPGARLHVLEGSSNLPFYGDQDEVLDAIEAFLDPVGSLLTERELDILARAAQGLSNREIAAVCHVSPHTVARHLANVFLKLEVSSRGAAVAAARSAGLLP